SEAGCTTREVEAAMASLAQAPGSLAAVARKLADAGINIEAAMPVGMVDGKIQIAFATDQPARAQSVLGGA
ncbi:MAG: hypothetical protein ACAH65_07725, partial [Chloroflexota bacterium]